MGRSFNAKYTHIKRTDNQKLLDVINQLKPDSKFRINFTQVNNIFSRACSTYGYYSMSFTNIDEFTVTDIVPINETGTNAIYAIPSNCEYETYPVQFISTDGYICNEESFDIEGIIENIEIK